jgi:hypothetical protein
VSDAGNTNGAVIDDPVVNSAVVGVDMLSGDGNDPGNPPARESSARAAKKAAAEAPTE